MRSYRGFGLGVSGIAIFASLFAFASCGEGSDITNSPCVEHADVAVECQLGVIRRTVFVQQSEE